MARDGGNDFDLGKIHYKGHCNSWALKIETFLGPEMASSEASAICNFTYSLAPPPHVPIHTALSTEQFRNQQRHIKYRYILYVPPVHKIYFITIRYLVGAIFLKVCSR